jgi:exonuclease VII small subunit
VPEITNDIAKTARDVAAVAKDAAYVVIGAGVLGFQRAQVQRQELGKRMTDPRSELELRLSAVRSDLGDTFQATEARVEELMDRLENVIQRVEAAVAPLEDRLPDQARDIAKQAHAQAREARTQLRTLIPGAA